MPLATKGTDYSRKISRSENVIKQGVIGGDRKAGEYEARVRDCTLRKRSIHLLQVVNLWASLYHLFHSSVVLTLRV